MVALKLATATMTVALERLTLRNFKGAKEFTLDAGGMDVAIYGDNATGKTTIADAIAWVLFHKNSANESKFEIKFLDENNEPVHFLDHEVELVLNVNGKEKTFRKVFAEVWEKSRGTAKQQFKGHETTYWVNGVPINKGDYDGLVADLCDTAKFQLLTNPMFFNVVLHWTNRRELLLQVCGDITDAEVIASSPDLFDLTVILADHTLDEHKKIIVNRKKAINEALDKIPVRIDEANRSMPTIERTPAQLAKRLETLSSERAALQAELGRIENGAQISEHRRAIAEIDAKIATLKSEQAQAATEAKQAEQAKLWDLKDKAETPRRLVARLGRDLEDMIGRARGQEDNLRALRQAFMDASAVTFTPSEEKDTCPACGQSLPADQVEAARTKALEDFNVSKAKRLETLKANGLAARADFDKATAKIAELQSELAAATAELETLDLQIADEESRIGSQPQAAPAMDPALGDLSLERREIEAKIEELTRDSSAQREAVEAKLREVSAAIASVETEKAQIGQREQLTVRIDELKAQEKQLSEESEKLERELFLTEEFTRAKVTLLEERINSKFSLVRFKLFNQLIHGGLEDCCIATINGVTYSDANHAAKVNAGLDIIKTLQAHYETYMPVVIDGAESVTQPLPLDCQTIKLIVSEPDKALRVVISPRQSA